MGGGAVAPLLGRLLLCLGRWRRKEAAAARHGVSVQQPPQVRYVQYGAEQPAAQYDTAEGQPVQYAMAVGQLVTYAAAPAVQAVQYVQ